MPEYELLICDWPLLAYIRTFIYQVVYCLLCFFTSTGWIVYDVKSVLVLPCPVTIAVKSGVSGNFMFSLSLIDGKNVLLNNPFDALFHSLPLGDVDRGFPFAENETQKFLIQCWHF